MECFLIGFGNLLLQITGREFYSNKEDDSDEVTFLQTPIVRGLRDSRSRMDGNFSMAYWFASLKAPMLTTIPACLVLASTVFAQDDSIPRQLAHTEQAFSADAEARGITASFREYFDDEAVMFEPEPVNAKSALEAETETPGMLVWSPILAEVSASLDFGYTTGPSEYRRSKESADTPYCVHFVSVWKKNREGRWKVILDIGSGCDKNDVKTEGLRFIQMTTKDSMTAGSLESHRSSMLAADRDYSAVAEVKGSAAAVKQFGSEKVRTYRRGKSPSEGRESGSALLESEKLFQFRFVSGKISSAGDLGYTYGTAITASMDTCNYVRIWRREKEWKVAVDVLNPWRRKK
jgi:ketosteroid isomerase-like protein